VEENFSQLGSRLKYFRKLRGYTNYERFAYEINISRTQYGKYEAGGNIKFSTLKKILKHLDITFKEFFQEGFDD
jgi:transcriptional regulator with XRE-family HTH domain